MSREDLGGRCGCRLVGHKRGCGEEEIQEVRGPDKVGPGEGSGLLCLCIGRPWGMGAEEGHAFLGFQ